MRLALALVAAGVFAGGAAGPFVFDDIPELVQNPDIRSISSCADTISRSADTGLAGRPVACISFALSYAMTGLNVRGFHWLNILIHMLAALTLFGLLRRTLPPPRGALDSSGDWLALGIATLWAVHPLQTESVTYVIQRIESLAGLWYLLTLYCVARACHARWKSAWQAGAIGCCGLGLLTKETLVTAPLVAFLYDGVCCFGSFGAALRRNRWLWVGLAATWLIPVILLSRSPRGATVGFDLGVSPLDYLRTQAGVIVHYLRLSFYPHPLSISYSDWPIVREWPDAVLPGSIILGLLLISTIAVIRKKWWGLAGAFFFLVLSPTSSFVPIVTEPAAERRMYLPLAAVVGLAVVLAERGTSRLLQAVGARPTAFRAVRSALFLIAAIPLVMRTVVRNADYTSAERLLVKSLAVRPRDELLRGALVDELARQNRFAEAARVQAEGLDLNPDSYALYISWGRSMLNAGRLDEALEGFREALQIRPDDFSALSGMGAALTQLGRCQEAVEKLRAAIRIKPDAYRARGNLGVALEQCGDGDGAVAEIQEALRQKPGFIDARYNLGRLLIGRGKPHEAAYHLELALREAPDDVGIRLAYAEALERGGRADEAIREYQAVLARDVHHEIAREGLRRLKARPQMP